MKLYYSIGVCSLAVRIVLHEMGMSCEYESVNLKTKQTETGADYLKINPKGAVPALQLDNNEILTENPIIQQYLADTHAPTPLLAPVGDMRRYRTLEWLNFINSDLHRNCAILFSSQIPEETKEKVFKVRLKNQLTVIDKHLQHNTFLMGDTLTLPDGYLFVIVLWMQKIKMDVSEWPNVARFFEGMKQRPSVSEALLEEGLVNA